MFVVLNEIMHSKHSLMFPIAIFNIILGIHVYYLLDPTFIVPWKQLCFYNESQWEDS